MQVLVVDDDAGIRNLLSTGLRRLGLSVDGVNNGAEALDRIEKNDYSVVLLDAMMPIINGLETLNLIALTEKRPVILLLTALPDGVIKPLDASLVAAIIRKPFDFWQVTEVVAEIVASVEQHKRAGFRMVAPMEQRRLPS